MTRTDYIIQACWAVFAAVIITMGVQELDNLHAIVDRVIAFKDSTQTIHITENGKVRTFVIGRGK